MKINQRHIKNNKKNSNKQSLNIETGKKKINDLFKNIKLHFTIYSLKTLLTKITQLVIKKLKEKIANIITSIF